MFGLFLNGEPIAMKVNFLASPGSFAFKIAYDERFSKFSPGVQLELENLRRLHETPKIEWMDSCAVPKHFMINRLWKERRTIQHVRVSTGGWLGNLEIGVRTLLRSIRRSWKSNRSVSPGLVQEVAATTRPADSSLSKPIQDNQSSSSQSTE